MAVWAFGMDPKVDVDPSTTLIEDHTHDPASPAAATSQASYVFASLRKVYPLPDGGVLWTTRDLGLPDEATVTPRHARVVQMRLSAMDLKRRYLDGAEVPRAAFRDLYLRTEAALGHGQPSGISAYSRSRLPTMPVARWTRDRARNLAVLRSALEGSPDVRLLDAPFAAVLVFDDAERAERVRAALIAERVYPATFWPLEARTVAGIPDEHVELSKRTLAIHADQRYSIADMRRVTDILREALGRA
jgi:hypothetical protein